MPTDHQKIIVSICLDRAEQAPVAQRVSIYRALAHFCGDARQSAEFRSIADALESAEKNVQQLSLFWRS